MITMMVMEMVEMMIDGKFFKYFRLFNLLVMILFRRPRRRSRDR
jgi:hypothetical protein